MELVSQCRQLRKVFAVRKSGNCKVKEQGPETQISCVTEHPGFQLICLDVWVLEMAYYRQL